MKSHFLEYSDAIISDYKKEPTAADMKWVAKSFKCVGDAKAQGSNMLTRLLIGYPTMYDGLPALEMSLVAEFYQEARNILKSLKPKTIEIAESATSPGRGSEIKKLPPTKEEIMMIKNFLIHMMSATSYELLNETGELYPELVERFNLTHVTDEWKEGDNLKMMTCSVLTSYIQEVVFTAVQNRLFGDKDFKELISMQRLFQDFLHITNVMFREENQRLVQEQIRDHIFRSKSLMQHCANELKGVLKEKVDEIKARDVAAGVGENKAERERFWIDTVALIPEGKDEKGTAEINERAISEWLNARDIISTITGLQKEIEPIKNTLSAPEQILYQELMNSKGSIAIKMIAPVSFLRDVYSRCPTYGKLAPILAASLRKLGVEVTLHTASSSSPKTESKEAIKSPPGPITPPFRGF